jgi:4-carboxymuconolactone decarboxylase
MDDHQPTPRLAPLAPHELTEEQAELLAALGDGAKLHIFSTLVRHPGLFRRWIGFAGKLLQGSKLPPRSRELVILRTAWRCHASYEWAQHVAIARTAGLGPEEILRVVAGPSAEGWSAQDATLLLAVDELVDDHCISDATWAELRAFLGEHQLIELPVLSGHYALLAGALNSFGVQTEGDLPALGEV